MEVLLLLGGAIVIATLVGVYLKSLAAGTTQRVTQDINGA